MVQIANSCSCWTFRFHVGVDTYAIKQEIVYTQGQLRLTHINIAILDSHVTEQQNNRK